MSMSSEYDMKFTNNSEGIESEAAEHQQKEDNIDFYVDKCNDCIDQLKNVILEHEKDRDLKTSNINNAHPLLDVLDNCMNTHIANLVKPQDQNNAEKGPSEEGKQFEKDIESLKSHHEQEVSQLRERIADLEAELERQKEYHSEIISSYEDRVKELKLENVTMQMSLDGFQESNQIHQELNSDLGDETQLYQNTFDTTEPKYTTLQHVHEHSHATEEAAPSPWKSARSEMTSGARKSQSVSPEKERPTSSRRYKTSGSTSSLPEIEEISDSGNKKRFSISSTDTAELQHLDNISMFQAEKEFRKALDSLEVRKGGSDWEKRVNAMKVIVKITKKPEMTDICAKEFVHMRPKLIEQLKDLRSSVIREACSVLVVYSELFGNRFQNNVNHFLPVLFQGLFVTIKAISIACHECIATMIENTKATKILGKILQGMVDSHTAVRHRCSEYLGMVLSYCTPDDENFQTNSSVIYMTLMKSLQDSDPKVRKYSRECFFKYRDLDPVAASDLYDSAPPTVRKHLA